MVYYVILAFAIICIIFFLSGNKDKEPKFQKQNVQAAYTLSEAYSDVQARRGLLINKQLINKHNNAKIALQRTVMKKPNILSVKPNTMTQQNNTRQDKTIQEQANNDEATALQGLLRYFTNGQDRWDILVAIGDIYARGAYPRWQPNPMLAMRCYKLAAMSPDGDVAGTAQVKAIDLRDHPLIDLDRQGAHLPTQVGDTACRIALDRIKTLPYDSFQKPVSKFRRTEPQAATRPQGRQATTAQQQQEQEPTIRPPAQRAYANDKQNVHDHGVVTGLKRVLSRLSSKSNIDMHAKLSKNDVERIKESAIESVLMDNSLTADEKTHAIVAVGALIGDHVNGSIGTTEVHALAIAQNTIGNIGDNDLKKNLKETLNRQLASAVENKHVVCSTGRIGRILGTFDGVPEIQGDDRLRPIWAVREEIASLAARVRDDVLRPLDEAEVSLYNRGQRPNIEHAMKKAFRDTVIATYVQELGMNKALIDPIISQYSDAF